MSDHHWGSDVPISRPVAPAASDPSVVNLGGIGFNENGITFHTTEEDIEASLVPFYMPRNMVEALEFPR
jgi:hypothetical protein